MKTASHRIYADVPYQVGTALRMPSNQIKTARASSILESIISRPNRVAQGMEVMAVNSK